MSQWRSMCPSIKGALKRLGRDEGGGAPVLLGRWNLHLHGRWKEEGAGCDSGVFFFLSFPLHLSPFSLFLFIFFTTRLRTRWIRAAGATIRYRGEERMCRLKVKPSPPKNSPFLIVIIIILCIHVDSSCTLAWAVICFSFPWYAIKIRSVLWEEVYKLVKSTDLRYSCQLYALIITLYENPLAS